jgi:hypothetical protein
MPFDWHQEESDMLRQQLIFTAIATCLAATALAAAELPGSASAVTAATAATLTATQIVERNVAARGGLRAWQHVQTMAMSGQIDVGKPRPDGGRVALLDRAQAKAEARAEVRQAVFGKGRQESAPAIQLPFRMELKRPLKSRLEIQFRGDTAVQVFDGVDGWKLRPFLGRHEVEPYSADELKLATQQQALDGPLIDYAVKGTQVTLEGSEMVQGRNTYKLKLAMKNGAVRHLWVDAETFLDSKIDGAPRRVDGHMRSVATYFRDYQAIDGLLVPHLMETVVDGVKESEMIHVEHVAMNLPVDDRRFGKPQ